MIEWRNKITVDGVPGIWTTNLKDEELRAFYAAYSNQIPTEDNINVGVSVDRSFGFKYYDRAWFRLRTALADGLC